MDAEKRTEPMRPVSLAFHDETTEKEYQHDTEMNNPATLRLFFKFSYLYVAVCFATECGDWSVRSVPVRVTLLKFLIICLSHWLTYWRHCRGWHLRLLSVLLSFLLVHLIAGDPTYPGFYFVLIENQVVQGILLLRKWRLHILLCTIEMVYLICVCRHLGVDIPILRLSVHTFGMILLHTGAMWVYEREIRLRWHAQMTLIQQEKRWRSMMELLSDPVIVSTSERLVYCNTAAKQYIQEGLGILQQIDSLIAEHEVIRARSLLTDGFRGIEHSWNQFLVTTSQGGKNVEVSFKPIDWDSEKVVMLVCHDVTEFQRTQQVKDNFLAACSHELRTPLNSILGLLELLNESGDLPSSMQKYTQVAFQSGQHLINLINDILDLSKLAAGKFQIHSVPFDIVRVAEETVEMISYQAVHRDIVIVKEFDQRLATSLVGDPGRFRQVLLNLLSNAVKFTSSGEIRVTLETVNDNENGNEHGSNGPVRVRCSVTDTGVGISADDASHLFVLFGKLKAHSHMNPSGSGLGLALCKELCAQMHGDIGVTSESGKGSTFSFTIQLQRPPQDNGKALSLTSSSVPATTVTPQEAMILARLDGSLSPRPLAKPVILLVEDNDFNVVVMHAFLDSLYQVIDARDGQKAVKMFENNSDMFDLILMDCQLPIVDGFQASEQIVKIAQARGLCKVPIIGLTAFAMDGDKQKCLASGMDDYLSKPVSKTLLFQTIEYWLFTSRSRCQS
eukprot:GILK01006352.1.p1 GENE.GILK01006352.1~~GILK01006352.1.p1  ORF type:complete len:750 (-),score=105.99 GILK01006352.1:269-2458(-)